MRRGFEMGESLQQNQSNKGHWPVKGVLLLLLIGVVSAFFIGQCSASSVTRPKRTRTVDLPVPGDVPTRSFSSGGANPAAGEIFGVPVSMENYQFARLVARTYSRPWGASKMAPEKREDWIWESLILHYGAFQKGITVSEEEIDEIANQFLKGNKQAYTRQDDPEAYKEWVSNTLGLTTEQFENQMRFLVQIRKYKEVIQEEAEVTVTEEEMQQEFLNEKNHVSGEMVTFETKAEAQEFYEQFKSPKAWEAMKEKGESEVRPVSMMTMEAYIDLWSIPHEQMYAFHAMEVGTVGPPMPFGKQWCVYRLLDKRTGDLADFPKEREAYVTQLERKKKYGVLVEKLEQLKIDAEKKVFAE